MAPATTTRDIRSPDPGARSSRPGRKRIVVIGIDQYRAWPKLGNAVQDARGALTAFESLGFEPVCAPIVDQDATGAALQHLVKDGLRTLDENDSLVVFYAGHGYTATTRYPDDTVTKKGYLLPVDAEPHGGRIGSWLKLDSWLGDLTHLPPRHILVIVDACKSGIALDPVVRWRGEEVRLAESMEALRARRSRRIITSALDDQLALDSGPVPGHSLFTGCLIEALSGGLRKATGDRTATGSEIGIYLQKRVGSYPNTRQTPDFGALELDNRGELIFDLAPAAETIMQEPEPRAVLPRPVGVDGLRVTRSPDASRAAPMSPPRRGVDGIVVRRASGRQPSVTPPSSAEQSALPCATDTVEQSPVVTHRSAEPATAPPPRRRSAPLEGAFLTALDRHEARRSKEPVISLVAAEPMTALTGWATWAASKGRLTLAIKSASLDGAITALLAEAPWLRILPAARVRLASAARLGLDKLDDALDAQATTADRAAWVDEVTEHDLHARVSGWLLSTLREPWAHGPDLTAAPVQGGDLLAILSDLAAPISVLFHDPDPSPDWLEHAIQAAYELTELTPRHAIAIAASPELVTRALRAHHESPALAMASRGQVPLAYRPAKPMELETARPEHALHAALANDARTRGLFEPNVRVPTHDRARPIEVDLVARDALLAVEIDDWYHFRDPQGYHRDRSKDAWLQRAGFFVMRFLAEDVENRLAQVIDEIALGLAGRRASGSFPEKAQ